MKEEIEARQLAGEKPFDTPTKTTKVMTEYEITQLYNNGKSCMTTKELLDEYAQVSRDDEDHYPDTERMQEIIQELEKSIIEEYIKDDKTMTCTICRQPCTYKDWNNHCNKEQEFNKKIIDAVHLAYAQKIKELETSIRKEVLLDARTFIGDLDYEDLQTKNVNEWVDEFILSKGITLK